MNLAGPFIRRPVGTALLTIAIALAGALGYLLLPVSPLPQIEFPTISVSAALPGASPETMASAVATPLERQFGRIAGITEMTSTSFLGLDLDHHAVRPRARHRRRGARRAGGDQRRAQPAAQLPARQPHLPQGQPRRRADHHPVADVPGLRQGAHVRRGLVDPGAEALAGAGGRAGQRRRRRAAGGARRRQPDRAQPTSAWVSPTCAPPWPPPTSTARRASSARATAPGRWPPPTSCRPPTSTARWSSPTAPARRCASATWRWSATASRTCAPPAWPTASRRC